ncbi:MAG: hypothetical protein HY513_01615 [Candidatus Aenigmarchaeota archaeon]|nr:hypothetical protein [Candidatus Aenigmarchaeota archaeon]
MDKIKLYLDTNMTLDFFINEATRIKGKGDIKVPEKTKFMTDNIEKMEFTTSFLTKAEIMRELVTGHDIESPQVEEMWSDLMKSLNNPHYIKEFKFDEKLVEMAGKLKLRLRTLFNFQHLYIAIDTKSYFVSGDKDIINKIRENLLYDKSLTYIELRQLIS